MGEGAGIGIAITNFGEFVSAISFESFLVCFMIILGGDTLRGVLEALNCRGIVPIEEIALSTVYGMLIREEGNMVIISKSGGLGTKDVLLEIVTILANKRIFI